MITISLCLIVKNEELSLENCLNSSKDIVDEIIIVDTGSTDSTKAIAEKFNAKIYDFQWCNDFSKARNYSFSKATKDYIFWLDADDMIPEKYILKFQNLKENLNADIDSVTMSYSRMRNENNDTIFSLRRHRLVKRKDNFMWFGRVHEYLAVYGNTLHSDIEIFHQKETYINTSRNLDIFLDMKNNNEEFTTRDLLYFANELFDNTLYQESAEQYELFLSKSDGWVEDKKTASFNLAKCYLKLTKQDKILPLLFNSFIYGKPRADICCSIANTLFQNEKYEEAIFWYKTAITCKPEKYYMGFDYKEYYTFLPCIQLCVCYSYLGDYEKAFYYNELACIYQTNSELTSHNKQYLIKKLLESNLPIPSI